MLLILSALARDIKDEPSKYGKFQYVQVSKESCKLNLITPNQGTVELQFLEDCLGLSAREKLGTAIFPSIAPDGTEFHVFSVSAMETMGNACSGDGMDLFVVLAPNQAWAVYSSGYCRGLDSAKVATTMRGTTLILEQATTTRMSGTHIEVWMGGSEEKELPQLPRVIQGTETATWTGPLSLQPRFWEEGYMEVNGEIETIYPEKCDLNAFGDMDVVVNVRREKLNDGRTENFCTAIKKSTP